MLLVDTGGSGTSVTPEGAGGGTAESTEGARALNSGRSPDRTGGSVMGSPADTGGSGTGVTPEGAGGGTSESTEGARALGSGRSPDCTGGSVMGSMPVNTGGSRTGVTPEGAGGGTSESTEGAMALGSGRSADRTGGSVMGGSCGTDVLGTAACNTRHKASGHRSGGACCPPGMQPKLPCRLQNCPLACVCGTRDGAVEAMSPPMVSRIVVAVGNVEGGPVASARLVGGVAFRCRPGDNVTTTDNDSTGGIGTTVGVAASGKVAGGTVASARLVLAGGTRTGMTPPAAQGRAAVGGQTSQLQEAEGPASTLLPQQYSRHKRGMHAYKGKLPLTQKA